MVCHVETEQSPRIHEKSLALDQLQRRTVRQEDVPQSRVGAKIGIYDVRIRQGHDPSAGLQIDGPHASDRLLKLTLLCRPHAASDDCHEEDGAEKNPPKEDIAAASSLKQENSACHGERFCFLFCSARLYVIEHMQCMGDSIPCTRGRARWFNLPRRRPGLGFHVADTLRTSEAVGLEPAGGQAGWPGPGCNDHSNRPDSGRLAIRNWKVRKLK